ncbi:MAG TPA: hypothetical protein VKP69_03880, partial [Isosphaeraceae bacterium]|nr:hypothetical protein [Isosphaeraceae bacterium]
AEQIDLIERPLSRRVMARWRAVNSSLMVTSVVRPLAIAHGGNVIQRGYVEEDRGADGACSTARSLSDALADHAAES